MEYVPNSTLNRTSEWVAGADGYPDGWMLVLWQPGTNTIRHRTVDGVEGLFGLTEAPAVFGIDMVIGLPDRAQPGGRRCDRLARALLGPRRGTSVFSPPGVSTLRADSYEDAQRLNRASGPDAPGLSRQSYHLLPKMRALAHVMTPEHQEYIHEVHPELSFFAMNDDTPLEASKHSEPGRRARLELLSAQGMPGIEEAIATLPAGPLEADDVLDAHAACWTAGRIRAGTAERCPPREETAPRNDRGLRMEIWR